MIKGQLSIITLLSLFFYFSSSLIYFDYIIFGIVINIFCELVFGFILNFI